MHRIIHVTTALPPASAYRSQGSHSDSRLSSTLPPCVDAQLVAAHAPIPPLPTWSVQSRSSPAWPTLPSAIFRHDTHAYPSIHSSTLISSSVANRSPCSVSISGTQGWLRTFEKSVGLRPCTRYIQWYEYFYFITHLGSMSADSITVDVWSVCIHTPYNPLACRGL